MPTNPIHHSLGGTTLALLVGAAAALSACSGDFRGNAVGETGTVLVVMDTTLWKGTVGHATREVFEASIETLPVPEPAFAVEHTDIRTLDQFERQIRKRKYIVFAGVLDDDNNVSRFLRSRLDSTVQRAVRAGEPGIYQLRDVWLREQLVYYLTANSDSGLAHALRDQAATLRYNLNEANRQQMEQEMFAKFRQTDVEEDMLDEHAFAVNVQHDYLVAVDTTNFFWMRRFVDAQNWRSVFVYWTEQADPSVLTPPWVLEARDRLTESWLTGNLGDFVLIDQRRPLTVEEVNFLDRYGLETRGLWHMVGYDQDGVLRSAGSGGPFLNYTFYDEEQGRLYMIDGMIFAPKYDKRELVRQLEVIAHTFRTRPEVVRRAAQTAAG